jgi:hypothetical protein
MKRFNLCSRAITGHQSRSLSEETIKERISSFHNFLDKHSPSSDSIINMDQTPVWLNIGCTGKTIHHKGAKEVIGYTQQGVNPREKISVILACDSKGGKLPPAIIVKSGVRAEPFEYMNGVLVFNNPKTSMANSSIMSEWIKKTLYNNDDSVKKLLILDSFKGHLTEQIRQTCQDGGITRAVIPGGLTKYCQPLDLTVNKSFKAKVKQFYRKVGLKESKQSSSQSWRSFNLNVFTRAIKHAWSQVDRQTIINGFEKMKRSRVS